MTDAQALAQAARQQWLLYYNRTLLEQGLISRRAHDRMLLKIRGRFAAPPGREPSEQNRCFPMILMRGLDQIQALVAGLGVK